LRIVAGIDDGHGDGRLFCRKQAGSKTAGRCGTPSSNETDLTGGGFALAYNAQNATDTRSELGTRFDNLQVINGMPLVLRGRLAWAHDWVSGTTLGAAFQALPGSTFTVNGAAQPQNSALTTAAAELHLTPNWTAIAKFDGAFGSGAQTYGGTARCATAGDPPLMKRLPDSLAIAFWTVGSCWLIAIMACVFGGPTELIIPLVMVGILTGLTEWTLRRQ
jgi:hypothetical protein